MIVKLLLLNDHFMTLLLHLTHLPIMLQDLNTTMSLHLWPRFLLLVSLHAIQI
jgi:hypothetical protein